MKIAGINAGLLLLFAAPALAESTADDWFLNHYASFWSDNPTEKLEEGVGHYAETVYLHPADGNVTAVNGREWLAGLLIEWASDGWLTSEVAELKSDQVNTTTATFTVKWKDRYEDGSEEFSCSWYVADLDGETWLVTQYADIGCADHGL